MYTLWLLCLLATAGWGIEQPSLSHRVYLQLKQLIARPRPLAIMGQNPAHVKKVAELAKKLFRGLKLDAYIDQLKTKIKAIKEMPTILNSKTEEDEDCKIIDWVTKRVENDFSAFKEHEIAEPWETYKKQWDGLNPTLLSKNEFLKCCSMPGYYCESVYSAEPCKPACIHRPSEENLADECPKCDPRIYKERSCEYTQRMWQLEACQVRKACSATGCSNSAPQIHIQVTQEILQKYLDCCTGKWQHCESLVQSSLTCDYPPGDSEETRQVSKSSKHYECCMQKKGQNRERSALECYNVYKNWTCLLLNRVFSQCEKCPEQNPDEIVNPTTDKKTSRTTLRPLLNSDEFGIDKDPNKFFTKTSRTTLRPLLNSDEFGIDKDPNKFFTNSDEFGIDKDPNKTTARTTTRATTSTKTRHESITNSDEFFNPDSNMNSKEKIGSHTDRTTARTTTRTPRTTRATRMTRFNSIFTTARTTTRTPRATRATRTTRFKSIFESDEFFNPDLKKNSDEVRPKKDPSSRTTRSPRTITKTRHRSIINSGEIIVSGSELLKIQIDDEKITFEYFNKNLKQIASKNTFDTLAKKLNKSISDREKDEALMMLAFLASKEAVKEGKKSYLNKPSHGGHKRSKKLCIFTPDREYCVAQMKGL